VENPDRATALPDDANCLRALDQLASLRRRPLLFGSRLSAEAEPFSGP